MKTKSQPINKSNEFVKFKEFARKLVKVPKDEINEQEKKIESQKHKEKANR